MARRPLTEALEVANGQPLAAAVGMMYQTMCSVPRPQSLLQRVDSEVCAHVAPEEPPQDNGGEVVYGECNVDEACQVDA